MWPCYCGICGVETPSKEPAFIKRGNGKSTRFFLLSQCIKCNHQKSKAIPKSLRKDWPGKNNDLDLEPGKMVQAAFTNESSKKGGILPLLPLLAAIGGIVAGVGGAAGGGAAIANTVINSNRAKEEAELARQNQAFQQEQERIRTEAYRKAATGGSFPLLRSVKQMRKDLKTGGSISEEEVKDMIKIFNGLGFSFVS